MKKRLYLMNELKKHNQKSIISVTSSQLMAFAMPNCFARWNQQAFRETEMDIHMEYILIITLKSTYFNNLQFITMF